MLDQAERLRKLARQSEENIKNINDNKKGSKIITVTSGKGGVGKSNLVVNLAITLSQIGKKVLILDADVGMANDDILMGFLPKYDISDIVINNMKIEEVLVAGPCGVKLLPGGSGITRLEEMSDDKREEFIERIAAMKGFDYIIMDTGAGVNKRVLSYIACCHELIVMTTPEPTSLTDAYSILKIVNNLKIKASAKLIVNKSLNSKEALATYKKFKDTVDKFLDIQMGCFGYILYDEKVSEGVRKQQPFVIGSPDCIASKNILSIADNVINNEDSSSLGMQEFFRKIFNIFS